MNTSKYIKITIAILVLLLVFFIIESFNKTNQGAYIILCDIVIELAACVSVIESKVLANSIGKRATRYFALMFFSLACADALWGTFFYIFKLSSRLPPIALAIAGSYAASFVFSTLGFLSAYQISFNKILFQRTTMIALLIVIPIASQN